MVDEWQLLLALNTSEGDPSDCLLGAKHMYDNTASLNGEHRQRAPHLFKCTTLRDSHIKRVRNWEIGAQLKISTFMLCSKQSIQSCIDLYVWSVCTAQHKCANRANSANSANTYSLFNNFFLSFSRWLSHSLVLFVSIRLSPAVNVPFRLWTQVYNRKPLHSSWPQLSQSLTHTE